MKLLIAAAANLSVLFGSAQEKKAEWATIQVPQVKCWECKSRLESWLDREKGPTGDNGIARYQINQGAGTIRIQYFPGRITLAYLRVSLNNAGFDADSTRATEDAYKTLPPACKRAEEGGGPQKGKPCRNEPLRGGQ